MKIDNKTHWRSDQILALANRVAQDELDVDKRKRYTVHVRYGHRGSATSGHAAYYGAWCQVNVGKDAVDPVNLAHTLAHEMAHSRGVRHPAMRGSRRYRYVPGWREFYGWAASFPIEQRPAKPKPTPGERRADRLARAEGKVAEWERKIKLANTKLRRWRRRVQALRRVALAAVPPPAAPRQAP